MKKFIRNNLKIILAIFATAIICISGTIFATYQYQASQVEYNGQSVESALNNLYNNMHTDLEVVEIINGGKNATSNSVKPKDLIVELNAGNYIVIIGEARRNAAASFGTRYDTTTTLGSLQGFTTNELILYTANGTYYETSDSRANLRTNIYKCYLENSGTITYLQPAGLDDCNTTMIILKNK